ncbi:MAG: TonB-dependent receptor, partial [Bacteroides sp.]
KLSTDSIYSLSEVIIEEANFNPIIPNKRLDGKQLENLNSHNIADALRYFSGVQIKDYGGMGGLKTINVRNMGSQHVGVFYDGLQLGNAMNGTVDLGKFSLDDIESLDLYNGQKSDIFQSAKDFSSGASVYIQSKRPKFYKDKKLNVLVRYKTGSINLINPSTRIEYQINNKWSVSTSAEYIKSNGKYKFRYKRLNFDNTIAYDTTATRQNSDIEAYRIEVGTYGELKDGFLEGKLYYYDSDRGLPAAIISTAKGLEWKNGERLGDKNFFGQLSYTKSITPKYKLRLRGKFAYDYTHYLSRDSIEFLQQQVTEKVQIDNTYYQQETYFSMANLYDINKYW